MYAKRKMNVKINSKYITLQNTKTKHIMALLEEKIQKKIDELIDLSYEEFQKGNYDKSFTLQNEAWELYPNPKEQWNEAYNLAKYIFQDYIKLGKFTEAKEWLEKMNEINNTLKKEKETLGYDEEVNFEAGKYFYETGNLEETYRLWREVVRRSGKSHFRFFEGEDKKYLEFYKSQTKLRESK